MIGPAKHSGQDQARSQYRQAALEYRLRLWRRVVDTVVALLGMSASHVNIGRAPSMREIESKEGRGYSEMRR